MTRRKSLAAFFGTVAFFATAIDSDLLAGLEARNIGSAGMSGRISAIASVASDPKTIVIGAASGAVWRSDNGGLSWTPRFDDQAVHSIGAVAINQRSPVCLSA